MIHLNRCLHPPPNSRSTQIALGLIFKVSGSAHTLQSIASFRPLYAVGARVPHRVYFDFDAPPFL